MKQVLFIVAAVGLFSCHSKPQKETQKIDTVLVAAEGPNGPFLDSAIRIVGTTRGFKDSVGLDGKMVEYTAYRIGQLTDTVRDSIRKPRLDPAGHPVVRLSYPTQYLDTANNKFVQVLSFPKH